MSSSTTPPLHVRLHRRAFTRWAAGGLLVSLGAGVSAQPAKKPRLEFAETAGVYRIAFHPAGDLLAVAVQDGPLDLWDLRTGQRRARLQAAQNPIPNSLAFSPDGATLVSGMGDGAILVWDVASGSKKHTLRGDGLAVEAVAVSPNNGILRASALSGVRQWDLAAGRELPEIPIASDGGTTLPVVLSARGTVLAAVGLDHSIRVWHLAAGKPRALTLKGHTQLVSKLAFTPDGKILVSGGQDDQIRVWDTATGRPLPLKSKAGFIGDVAISPDGRTAASGTFSGSQVTLWDLATNRVVATLPGADPDRSVLALAFSADGRTLAVGEGDRIRVWDVPQR
ncbi:MAG: WD40 repeat domain-containing protein [Armatimonadota bacterium]